MINFLFLRQLIRESLQCAFLYRQIMVERKGHHHWFWKGLKIGASHLSKQREGGTTELCYAAGKSQMAISDPYQSAKWLKVHLAKWRLASSIIHDALFSLLQGIHCSPQFYIQLLYKATLSFTLRIQMLIGILFLILISILKQKFTFLSLLCWAPLNSADATVKEHI